MLQKKDTGDQQPMLQKTVPQENNSLCYDFWRRYCYSKTYTILLYSKTRNYLYTHKMARLQTSPAAVGYLFPVKL